MRILIASIVVTGIGAGLFANPVIAEQANHDTTIEKWVIKALQLKINAKQLRGFVEPGDAPAFVTLDDATPKARTVIEYQVPKPDLNQREATALLSAVYVNPFKVDTVITASTAQNGKAMKRYRLIWKKFDGQGNPISSD